MRIARLRTLSNIGTCPRRLFLPTKRPRSPRRIRFSSLIGERIKDSHLEGLTQGESAFLHRENRLVAG